MATAKTATSDITPVPPWLQASIAAVPAMVGLYARVLWQATFRLPSEVYYEWVVTEIAESLGADFVAIVSADAGNWHHVAEAGEAPDLPLDLLSETLDLDQSQARSPWFVAPLSQASDEQRLLVVRTEVEEKDSRTLGQVASLATVVERALAVVLSGEDRDERIKRLEAMLEMSGHWYRAHDMESLLGEMAQAATKLLNADRASIFLWDRSNHTLIGRPALGVDGGELRVPDNEGVVGEVLRTELPARIGHANGQDQINRNIDQQLGYQTDTILCVPLHGSDGKPLGVFEVINRLEGEFTSEDEAMLVELAEHAAASLENTQERQQLLKSRQQMTEDAAGRVQLIGESPAIEALRSTVCRVADTDLAVLILGENGTGKEVVSQMVHYLSPRREEPFIAVNCAAISENLIESELFGHEKGAFTDARETRIGKFELASGGTLFLDEIGDLSLAGQAKLLRVLEEKTVIRVGGSTPIHVDVRVIAATNQDLASMVRSKKFREDLYFRLNVVTLDMPALRDRPTDVMLLAEHFVESFCRKARRPPLSFTAEARRRLQRHTWPGNVRELRNLIERLCYLQTHDKVDADDLAFIFSPTDKTVGGDDLELPLSEATDRFQAEHIQIAIDRSRGNMSEAAKRLGLHRSNLYRKMRQLGIDSGTKSDE